MRGMSDKSFSENGKKVSEGGMSTVALREALTWHDRMMDTLHRGRGDKEKRVRGELSDISGIPESYLFRLQHKRRDMRDIAGEVYRRLGLAYERVCVRVETSADGLERLRQEIEASHEASTSPETMDARGVAPAQSEKE
jgi:hypothetical protein